MAFDVSATNLYEEIRAAERVRNEHREIADSLVRSFTGKSFRRHRRGAPTPANHGYEFVSLMLGRLISDNPAVAIESRRAGDDAGAIAIGLEDALNQWIATENPQDELLHIVEDSFFFVGVCMVTMQEENETRVDGPEDPSKSASTTRMVPKLQQINYWRYLRDPMACNGIPCRYEGHLWMRDQDDLLKDPDFDHDAIKDLMADVDVEKVNPAYDEMNSDMPRRKQIVAYDIWVPDAELPEGYDPDLYHGMIYTLGVAEAGKNGKKETKREFIRKPRPFFGPATGPYTMFGGWPVPGSAYPMAPLVATKEQADELNAHEVAISKAALRMKTVHIVNASQKTVGDIVKGAETGTVHSVAGFMPNMLQTIETKGPSDQQLLYREHCQNRLDRVSGLDDATRGNLDPRVSATATNRAAQGDTIRTGTLVRFINRSTRQALTNVAWYMYHSEFFTHTLTKDASEKTGMNVFSGGNLDHPMSAGLRFRDLALDIEPYSMEAVDPERMQLVMTQLIPQLLQLAQAEITMPHVNFEPVWESYARFNRFRWIKKLIDRKKLEAVRMSQAQAAQKAEEGERKPPTLPYADVPNDVKAQIEAAWGFKPSELWANKPLYDPTQPRKSGNMATVPNPNPVATPGSIAQRMMGKAGAPRGRPLRNPAPSSSMGGGAPPDINPRREAA